MDLQLHMTQEGGLGAGHLAIYTNFKFVCTRMVFNVRSNSVSSFIEQCVHPDLHAIAVAGGLVGDLHGLGTQWLSVTQLHQAVGFRRRRGRAINPDHFKH